MAGAIPRGWTVHTLTLKRAAPTCVGAGAVSDEACRRNHAGCRRSQLRRSLRIDSQAHGCGRSLERSYLDHRGAIFSLFCLCVCFFLKLFL